MKRTIHLYGTITKSCKKWMRIKKFPFFKRVILIEEAEFDCAHAKPWILDWDMKRIVYAWMGKDINDYEKKHE